MKKIIKLTFKSIGILFFICIIGAVIFINNFDINSYKGRIISEVNKATGAELGIAGEISLGLSLHPYVEVNDVTFKNPKFSDSQNILQAKKASVAISVIPLLYDTISINSIILQDTNINLVSSKKGNNWELDIPKTETNTEEKDKKTETTSSSNSNYTVKLGKISASNVKISYLDEINNNNQHLNIKSLQLNPNFTDMDIDAIFDYNGIPIEITGTTSLITSIMTSNEVEFDLDVSIIDSKLSMSGKTDTKIKDFVLSLQGKSPEASTVPNKLGLEIAKLGAVDIDTSIDGSLDAMEININHFKLGTTSITGDANIKLTPNLDISFNLNSPMIDLISLQENASSSDKQTTSQTSSASSNNNQKIFPNTPLPLEFLKTGTVKGLIQIEKIVWGNKKMPITSSLYTDINLKNSVLKAIIDSKTGDGHGAIDINLKSSNNNAILDLNGNVEIPAIASFFPKSDDLTGMPVNLKIKGSSTGSSVAALMSRLKGNIYLNIGKGTIKKDALSWVTGDLLMDTVTTILPHLDKNKNVDFYCGAANINITNGVMNLNRTFAVQTDKFNMITDGNVNLAKETLAVGISMSSLKGLQVGISDILSNMIQVQGTLAHPSIGMGAAQAINTALKVGVAVLTGGLSLAGEQAYDIASSDPNPCETAWNYGKQKSPTPAQTTTKATERTIKATTEETKKVIKGAIDGLKSLF